MLDYNQNTVHSNNAPSVRQRMINEALDYHQNMNSVVFKREAKNLEVYNNPSGKTDPSQGDILVDGTIKQRVSEIAASIQKLNQTITYASSTQISGSGKSKSTIKQRARARANKKALATQRPVEEERQEHSIESYDEYLDDMEDFISRVERPGQLQFKDVKYPNLGPARPGQFIEIPEQQPEYQIPTPEGPMVGIREVGRFGEQLKPQKYYSDETKIKRAIDNPYSGLPNAADVPGLTSLEDAPPRVFKEERYTGFQSESDPESDRPSIASTASPWDVADLEPLGPGEKPFFDRSETEVAAGPVSVISPNGKVSSKIKMLIDDSLAKIVASFNNLIEFIDFQVKQRKFTQNNEQDASAACKELLPSLKLLIANAGGMADRNDVQSMMDYTRIFNVISEIISKIESSPPFLKVSPSLLSEPLPIRRDILKNKEFDASKIKNHTYLQTLVNRLDTLAKHNDHFQPLNNPIEIEAKRLKSQEIDSLRREIQGVGFKTSDEALGVIDEKIKQLSEEMSVLPTGKFLRKIESKKEDLEEDLAYKESDIRKEDKKNQRLDSEIQRLKEQKRIIREYNASDVQPRIKQITADLEHTVDILKLARSDYDLLVKRVDDFITDREHLIHDLDRMTKEYEKPGTHRRRTELLEKIQETTEYVDRFNETIEAEESDIEYVKQNIDRLEGLEQDQLREYERLGKQDEHHREHYEKLARTKRRYKATPRLSDARDEYDYISRKHQKILNKKEEAELGVEKRKGIKSKIKEELEKSKYHRRNKEKVGRGGQSPFSPSGGGGMEDARPHTAREDPFGDSAELEPYLTKYLRPSKHRNEPRPKIESSSEESSGDEEPTKVTTKRTGGKRAKKLKEDWEIIETELHPDKAVLIEKKLKSKRIGRGKKVEATKPAHTTAPSQDLWFM